MVAKIYCVAVKSFKELEKDGLLSLSITPEKRNIISNFLMKIAVEQFRMNSFTPIKWPELCPCCCEPSDTTQEWEVKEEIQESISTTTYTQKYTVPYCINCKDHIRAYLPSDNRSLKDKLFKSPYNDEAIKLKKKTCSMVHWAFYIDFYRGSFPFREQYPEGWIQMFFFANQEFANKFAKLNYNSSILSIFYKKDVFGFEVFSSDDKLIQKYLQNFENCDAGFFEWYMVHSGLTVKEIGEL